MNRRILLAVGASALIAVGSLPAMAMAAGPSRPTRHVDLSKVDPSFQPLMADASKSITVVLQLDGTSVLQAGGTKTEQATRAASLKVKQAAISKSVATNGGKVTSSYRFVYNGLRVVTTGARIADLAAIPGVVAVRPLHKYTPTNTAGVPAIGAPTAWGVSDVTGEGVQIAIIDTGIDYTHATFDGDGTPLAYTSNDPTTIEPLSFPTEKVIAGYDFAGDGYDANGDLGSPFPTPDADPLDCAGHGSHVAGTAAGYGVKTDHSTFPGPWDAATIGDGSGFVVGPGVAPEADLIALKVFGCEGSTDLVVDALDWVAEYNAFNTNPIDVVNMSLGSSYGSNTDPDAVATNTLVASGVTVVASAGNSGPVSYITGAPAAATKSISVAALDAVATVPMAIIDNTGPDLPALNQNASTALPVTGTLNVLETGTSDVSIGCATGDYVGVVPGQVVAVKRGTCAFVEKAALAAVAGAAAIIIINRDDQAPDALPTYIGVDPTVAIPMLGTANTIPGGDPTITADQMDTTLIAIDGTSVTLNSAPAAANPTYRQVASFSSSGPRWGDSWLKADLAAPGVSIVSTAVGSGWNGITFSGTSMAAPMTSGAAALVVQAHPTWSPLKIKAALSNTADGANVIGYTPLRAGSGKIRVDRAARANVTATTSDGTASLSYGYVQATGAWAAAKRITITNDGSSSAVYKLTSSSTSVTIYPTKVTVAAHKSVTVTVTARLSAAQTAAFCGADPWVYKGCQSLYTRSGIVTATPVSAKTGQYALRVPFLVVPRGVSSLTASRYSKWTTSSGKTSGKLVLANTGNHSGYADVYALGVTDVSGDGTAGTDIRAAGVQTLSSLFLDPDETYLNPATDKSLVFAVNMYDKSSSFTPHQIDISVDTTGDKVADFHLLTYDEGLFFTGAYSGVTISLVTDADYNLVDGWYSDTPLNGSTVLVSAAASDFGLSAGTETFSYRVAAYNGFTGWPDATGWSQSYDAFSPKISNGQMKLVARKTATTLNVFFYRAANPKGWLVVTMDDRNGSYQADIVGLP